MARPYRPRRWRQIQADPAACLLLSRELGILPVTAQVLYNRGLCTPDQARTFLTAGRDQILDPFLLKDMDRAVGLIRRQIADDRPIMVYGDYDVDGVTGTTILVLALRALGARVEYYIPDRFSEGYGLNPAALAEIRDRGIDFILSVDTGVSAVAEAKAARELGITLVVSDHHEPGAELPDVPALINPKRRDCTYPFKGLSGVGVAFKLALALEAPNVWELLDIVALGTIADMVPLLGENRAMVREGLEALGRTRRPGLRALMGVAAIREPVTATHIAFALAPRINALGRMGSAMTGVELMITDDPDRARTLALHLDSENRSRQEVEAAILEEALQQAERQDPAERSHVLVLAGEGWHHGVVGICASRVLEAYHRPAILLSIDGDEVRGSARSIPAFHLHRALTQVADLFIKFGGHAAAAGMTLKRREDIPVLRERLNRIAAAWLQPEDLVPELRVDARVRLGEVSEKLLAELQSLQPHGIGNPQPILAVTGTAVLESRTMGREQQHLKLLVGGSSLLPMEAVGWNMAPARPSAGAEVRLAFWPEWDTYNGRNRLRLTVKDLQVELGEGVPVSEAVSPGPQVEQCLLWNPLADLDHSPAWGALLDGRGARLQEALASLNPSELQVEAAAARTAEPDGDPAQEMEAEPDPTRLIYLERLAAPADSRLLVLTASPWAAAELAIQLRESRPDLRQEILLWYPGEPEPASGRILVASFGVKPATFYTDTVLYHPPYHEGQVRGSRVHLLWKEAEWDLVETSLGWAYPDRETLVSLYKLIRSGNPTAEALAEATGEVFGPWTELRLESCRTIFQEVGLLDLSGQMNGKNGERFQLESSERYRLGMAGRSAVGECKASDWPARKSAI